MPFQKQHKQTKQQVRSASRKRDVIDCFNSNNKGGYKKSGGWNGIHCVAAGVKSDKAYHKGEDYCCLVPSYTSGNTWFIPPPKNPWYVSGEGSPETTVYACCDGGAEYNCATC